MRQSSRRGSGLVLLAGMLGTAIAAYDYFDPLDLGNGIDHTKGVELVLASSLLLILGAVVVLAAKRGFIAALFIFLIFLDIVGTAVAGWFLDSWLMLAAMLLAAIGWLQQIGSKGTAA